MTFRVLLRQNYTSVTPTTFRRQTTFILEVKSQKSIISEKSQKSRKKCQKSRFFKNFWLLSLPTSLRAITLLPVLDRTAKQKSWKIFKKLRAGMTFLKKSVFDPPNRPKVQFTRFQPRWDHIQSHFFTISRPHAKSHQLLTAHFRDRKTFCTLDP